MRNFRPKERRSYNLVELESDHLGSNPGATIDYLADLGQVTYLLWVRVHMLPHGDILRMKLYDSCEELKNSQIYNIISETKFRPSHNLKLWLNDFHANCFPTWIITYIVPDVVKGQKD